MAASSPCRTWCLMAATILSAWPLTAASQQPEIIVIGEWHRHTERHFWCNTRRDQVRLIEVTSATLKDYRIGEVLTVAARERLAADLRRIELPDCGVAIRIFRVLFPSVGGEIIEAKGTLHVPDRDGLVADCDGSGHPDTGLCSATVVSWVVTLADVRLEGRQFRAWLGTRQSIFDPMKIIFYGQELPDLDD